MQRPQQRCWSSIFFSSCSFLQVKIRRWSEGQESVGLGTATGTVRLFISRDAHYLGAVVILVLLEFALCDRVARFFEFVHNLRFDIRTLWPINTNEDEQFKSNKTCRRVHLLKLKKAAIRAERIAVRNCETTLTMMDLASRAIVAEIFLVYSTPIISPRSV